MTAAATFRIFAFKKSRAAYAAENQQPVADKEWTADDETAANKLLVAALTSQDYIDACIYPPPKAPPPPVTDAEKEAMAEIVKTVRVRTME